MENYVQRTIFVEMINENEGWIKMKVEKVNVEKL